MRIESDEHAKFLKKLKYERYFIRIFRISIIFVFLVFWEILTRNDIINGFLFSSPSRVFNTTIKLINDGMLFKHIGITLLEVMVSFIISNILGFIISVLFLSNSIIYKIFDPYLTIINSLPKVALGPLIIIWIGAGFNSIVFMALMISLFITIINIYNGFINVNRNYIVMIKSFGASRWDIFFKVILPSSLYNVFSTLKINISMNLIGVIMGELLVSKIGIGYLIMYGSQVFNIDLVITGVIILGIISYIMYLMIEVFESRITKKYNS